MEAKGTWELSAELNDVNTCIEKVVEGKVPYGHARVSLIELISMFDTNNVWTWLTKMENVVYERCCAFASLSASIHLRSISAAKAKVVCSKRGEHRE